MTAYALFMWVEWEEAKEPDTPSAPPALNALSHLPQRAFGMKDSTASIITDPLDGLVLEERMIAGPQFTDDEPGRHPMMGMADDPASGKAYAHSLHCMLCYVLSA
jgi:hypothetical protein